jgi:zinc/manganese transport system substrate-binding protein
MKKILIMMTFLLFTFAAPAQAKLNVVATLPWIGSLASDLGGDRVKVTVLVKPVQDPHAVEAKPSMILAARNADILLYNGLDLEIGYLSLLIESSRNPSIQSGQPGNIDCSQFVSVIEKMATSDRSLGDVHPLGNPHYHLSPVNIRKIATGMAQALSSIDGANAAVYETNLVAFIKKLTEKEKAWYQKRLNGRTFVSYHKFFEYAARDFNFQIVGYVEAKPGIPPSAGHVKKLIEMMKKARPDAILTTSYNGKREVESLSKRTGVKGVVVPHDIGARPGIGDWFQLMDAFLASLL